MSETIDITKSEVFALVRNEIYLLIQQQLRQPDLKQTIGYDLANFMFNSEYSRLKPKHKEQFDAFIVKILKNTNGFVFFSSKSVSEIVKFHSDYNQLKLDFDKQTNEK